MWWLAVGGAGVEHHRTVRRLVKHLHMVRCPARSEGARTGVSVALDVGWAKRRAELLGWTLPCGKSSVHLLTACLPPFCRCRSRSSSKRRSPAWQVWGETVQTGAAGVSAGCPGFECRGSKVPVCCPNPPAAGTCALSSVNTICAAVQTMTPGWRCCPTTRSRWENATRPLRLVSARLAAP